MAQLVKLLRDQQTALDNVDISFQTYCKSNGIANESPKPASHLSLSPPKAKMGPDIDIHAYNTLQAHKQAKHSPQKQPQRAWGRHQPKRIPPDIWGSPATSPTHPLDVSATSTPSWSNIGNDSTQQFSVTLGDLPFPMAAGLGPVQSNELNTVGLNGPTSSSSTPTLTTHHHQLAPKPDDAAMATLTTSTTVSKIPLRRPSNTSNSTNGMTGSEGISGPTSAASSPLGSPHAIAPVGQTNHPTTTTTVLDLIPTVSPSYTPTQVALSGTPPMVLHNTPEVGPDGIHQPLINQYWRSQSGERGIVRRRELGEFEWDNFTKLHKRMKSTDHADKLFWERFASWFPSRLEPWPKDGQLDRLWGRTVIEHWYSVLRLQPYFIADILKMPVKKVITEFLRATLRGFMCVTIQTLCSYCRMPITEATSLADIPYATKCGLCGTQSVCDINTSVVVSFSVNPSIYNCPVAAPFLYLPRAVVEKQADRVAVGTSPGYFCKTCEIDEGEYSLFCPFTQHTIKMFVAGDKARYEQMHDLWHDAAGFRPSSISCRPGLINIKVYSERQDFTFLCLCKSLTYADWRADPIVEKGRHFYTLRELLHHPLWAARFNRAEVPQRDQQLVSSDVSVGFCQVWNAPLHYTKIGEFAAFTMLRERFSVLRRCITHHGGRAIREIGDGLMSSFTKPINALMCMLHALVLVPQFDVTLDSDGTLCGEFTYDGEDEELDFFNPKHNLKAKHADTMTKKPTEPLELVAAVYYGSVNVVQQDNNLSYFGRTINAGLEVTQGAQRHEVVVSKEVWDDPSVQVGLKKVAQRAQVRTVRRRINLKTLRGSFTVYAVFLPTGIHTSITAFDPTFYTNTSATATTL